MPVFKSVEGKKIFINSDSIIFVGPGKDEGISTIVLTDGTESVQHDIDFVLKVVDPSGAKYAKLMDKHNTYFWANPDNIAIVYDIAEKESLVVHSADIHIYCSHSFSETVARLTGIADGEELH